MIPRTAENIEFVEIRSRKGGPKTAHLEDISVETKYLAD
jgi:hypothetical protein